MGGKRTLGGWPGRALRLAAVAVLTALTTGCFLRLTSGFVFTDDLGTFVDLVFADVSVALCVERSDDSTATNATTNECEYSIATDDGFGERTSTVSLLGEFGLFGLLVDPVIVQVPQGSVVTAATVNDGSGPQPLRVTVTPAFDVEPGVTVTAENGHVFWIVELPAAIEAALSSTPIDLDFIFRFNVPPPAPAGALPLKVLFAGRVEAGGRTFYVPLLPCTTDLSQVPPVPIPIEANLSGLDEVLAALFASTPGCQDQAYDFNSLADGPADPPASETAGPDPDATRAEGVLWTAAEQAVSIVAGNADSSGCFSASGSTPVSISVGAAQAAGEALHFEGLTTLGDLDFLTVEKANDGDDVRVYLTSIPAGGAGPVSGKVVSDLLGRFVSDGPFAVLHGNAEWRHGAASLDEHLLKDFFAGAARPATFKPGDPGSSIDCTEPTVEQLNAGVCVVDDPGDANPDNPLRPVRIVRDTGLEVTSKAASVDDLLSPATRFTVGAPKGKWRQTSFYREPDGPGEGRLTYTKVRIAPFASPVCALQLDCVVDGTVDNPTCQGAVTVFPLGP